jgi:hypothetical protein
VDLSHPQFMAGLLENRDDRVADAPELTSAVRGDATGENVPTAHLLPIASHETLEKGRQVMV